MVIRQPKTDESVAKLEPEAIPEVTDFMIADQELNEYVEEVRLEYPNVLENLERLAEIRNAALEAADKAVRAKGKPCGPFEVHQVQTLYDAVALYDSVGETRFIELGGSIETKRVLVLDKKRFDAALAQRKVSLDVENAVRTHKVTFKVLKRVWGG